MARIQKALCAFCGSSMKVYGHRHLGPVNFLMIGILSFYLMFVVWDDFDLRALAIFVCLAFIGEVLTHLRWRLSLQCKSCGFDPVLYKKNNEAAAQKVKAHLEHRKMDPTSFLRPMPKLPVRKVKPGAEKSSKNTLNLQI